MDLYFKNNVHNNPLQLLSKTHYSIIAVFQYSNWGEAPKFIDYFNLFLSMKCFKKSMKKDRPKTLDSRLKT